MKITADDNMYHYCRYEWRKFLILTPKERENLKEIGKIMGYRMKVKNAETGEIYPSITKCAKAVGTSQGHVSNVFKSTDKAIIKGVALEKIEDIKEPECSPIPEVKQAPTKTETKAKAQELPKITVTVGDYAIEIQLKKLA